MSVLLAAAGNPHLSFIDGVESTDVDVRRASNSFLISSEGWIYPIYRFNQLLMYSCCRSADDGAVQACSHAWPLLFRRL